jgi:hypothetical protein
MWAYRLLYAFDAIATLVLAYFFLDGLRDATNADYVAVWLPLLIVPAGILIAAPMLRQRGHNVAAMVLLGLLAVPPLLFALFFGLLIALNPRWN